MMQVEQQGLNYTGNSGTIRRIKRDYWEQEKEKLVTVLKNYIARDHSSIPLREILVLDIPEIFKAAFCNHARNLVRKEKPLVLQTLRQFELDDSEFRDQFRILRDLLVDRIVFDVSELTPILKFGIDLQFDVIARPRSALVNILYGHSVERDRNDIIIVLRGLGEEKQYVGRVSDKIGGYPDGPVTKEAFIALCHQTERELYGKDFITGILNDLKEFRNYSRELFNGRLETEEPSDSKINNQIVLAMLYERELMELAEELLPEITQRESWEIKELEELIKRIVAESGIRESHNKGNLKQAHSQVDLNEFLKQAANEIENQLVSESDEISNEEVRIEADQNEEKTTNQVLNEELDKSDSEIQLAGNGSHEKEKTVGEALAEKSKIIINYDEEEQLIYRSKIEQQPAGPFPSLTRLIDDRSRKAFIRKIFDKDVDIYLEFIERLEAAKTWKEAKFLLDAELNKRKVNPYSKEAVRLSDLLFGRYFSKF